MLKVLELGSGTGLVGLAAAAIWKCIAYLTDLPDIVENLDRNIERNCMVIGDHGGRAEAEVIDWSNPPAVGPGGTFPVGREYLLLTLAAEKDYRLLLLQILSTPLNTLACSVTSSMISFSTTIPLV
jgi:hypothetical protein